MRVTDLPGLPDMAAALCQKLLAEPPAPIHELRGRSKARIELVAAQANTGSLVDISLARQIATALDVVLEAQGSEAAPDAYRALHMTVRYFEVEDDGSPDTAAVIGFEDEAQVVNAVLRFVRSYDLFLGAPSARAPVPGNA